MAVLAVLPNHVQAAHKIVNALGEAAQRLPDTVKTAFWAGHLHSLPGKGEEVLKHMRETKCHVITTAYHWPDLDGIAGACGLYGLYLRLGVNAAYAFHETPQPEARWACDRLAVVLPQLKTLLYPPASPLFPPQPSPTISLVDASDRTDLPRFVDPASVGLVIDHRLFNGECAFANARYWLEPTGSASSLITRLYALADIIPQPRACRLLYCALMSNTVRCRTGNTTAGDLLAARYLESISAVEPGLIDEMFAAKSHIPDLLKHLDDDMSAKTLSAAGEPIGIAQLEINNALDIVRKRKEEIDRALSRLAQMRGAQAVYLLLLDTSCYRTRVYMREDDRRKPSAVKLRDMLPWTDEGADGLSLDTLCTRKELSLLMGDKF